MATKDEKLLADLEEVAQRLGARVTYEVIKKNTSSRQPKGGLCYVDSDARIIIHKKLPDSEKVQVLIDSIREFDLESVFIAPELRQVIEGASALLK